MTRVRTLEHVADVRRRPGVQRPVVRTFPADVFGPIGTSSATVPPDGEIVLDATVEATGLDIVLSGTATAPWEGACRRCLRDVTGTIDVELQEIFSPHPVEGETWPVDHDSIDLGPVVHDAVLLSLPLVPLCAEDCVGPDPERFPALVEGDPALLDDDEDEAPAAPPADPRWAALDDLKFD